MKRLSTNLGSLALAMLIFSACLACGEDSPGDPVVLRFSARAGATPIGCTVAPMMLGTPAQPMRIADFRLFVSDFRLVDADGKERKLTLERDGKWQDESTALLDFEDASGPCADFGTREINTTVRGTAPSGTTTHLRFTLGVPFNRNHQLPTNADAPFNLGAMHWDWQAGYKFTRLELEDAMGAFDYLIHLGSTGCSSSAASAPPSTECAHPNRATITLPFDPAKNTVVLDLAAFLAASNLAMNTANTPPGCMSGNSDPECQTVFTNLGLDPATGACMNGCASQILFRAE